MLLFLLRSHPHSARFPPLCCSINHPPFPRTGRPQLPTSIRVDSRVAHGTLRGWTTSQGYTLLTAPLELALECLPPLARRLLARLNPLLGATLTLGPEDRPLAVRLSVVPQDALLPAAACLVRVDPLEVTLSSSGALLEPLARLRSLGGAVPRLPERVSAGVSGLEAVVDDGGGLTAAALDLTLMLPARTRVGLTTWGSAALHHPERLDWVVAVPGATLQALGVRGVEEDRGVAMLVTGSPLAPTPQLARCGDVLWWGPGCRSGSRSVRGGHLTQAGTRWRPSVRLLSVLRWPLSRPQGPRPQVPPLLLSCPGSGLTWRA